MTNSLYTNYSFAHLINKKWSFGYGLSGHLIDVSGDEFMEEKTKSYNFSLDTKYLKQSVFNNLHFLLQLRRLIFFFRTCMTLE